MYNLKMNKKEKLLIKSELIRQGYLKNDLYLLDELIVKAKKILDKYNNK